MLATSHVINATFVLDDEGHVGHQAEKLDLPEQPEAAVDEKAADRRGQILHVPVVAPTPHMGDELFGRCEERGQLLVTYDEMKTGGPNSLVLITGQTGAGKTMLADSLRATVQQDRGYFVSAKFDSNAMTGPMVMMNALEHVIEAIEASGEDAIKDVKIAVEKAENVDTAVLVDMVPSLRRILGDDHGEITTSRLVDHTTRKTFVLRAFFEAMSSPERPLVLVLNDVNAADACAINILRVLMAGPKKCMLFVATYRRDTETTNCLIDGLHRQGVAVKNIQLPNLDEDTTVTMVSSMLSTRPQLCESVSRFVFHHSNGNPLYIVELLRFMHETGLAVLDQTSGRWTSVQPSVDSVLRNFDCLHEVVTQRLMLETKGVQELLKVAACLGSALNEKLLSLALSAPVSHYVSIAADRGLLVYNETSRNYCFANSMVHDASYALIPVDELQAVHLAIGRKIWRRLDEADLQQHFLLILSQFNKGKQLVTNENEKYALSTLHLQIAEMVARKSNFPLASELLDGAISLLCENHWRNRYDLSLSLFNTAAEVEYTRGNFDKVKIYIEEILRNARSLDDKLQAQTTQIYTLIANDKLEQGLDAGLKALAQLGEVFHSRPSNARIRFELMKTTRLLRGESDEKIMRLPTMQDSRKGAAMQLMNMVFSCAFAAKPMLCPLLCLRMVNLTLVDGLCAVSSFAFATYGMLLCSYNFDFAGGYRYGQLALKLLDRFGAKEWLPRVYAGVYGFIHGWNRPMELAMKPLWHAIQVGLETGDIEFAGLNAHICITIMFERGKPLNELNDRMMNFTGELRMLKQESMVNINKPLRYMIEALIGNDNECTGSASAGNPIRGGHFESDHVYAGCWIHFQRCIVTYIFGDFETAVIEGSKAKSCVASPYQTVDLACMLLFDGLASLGLCQQPGRHRRHLITTAKRHISVIEKISCGAPEYCLGKVFLLRAELSVTTRKFDKAHSEYISAIALSSKGGLLMEEAIANERAGRCMQMLGDSRSTAFLNEALELYEKWGAKAKACKLRTEILDASSKQCTPASAARPQSLH